MLVDLILIIIGKIFEVYASFAPTFSVWPDIVPNMLNYCAGVIMKLDFSVVPMDALLDAISFLIKFFAYYYLFRLGAMIFNYLRGVGSGIDI